MPPQEIEACFALPPKVADVAAFGLLDSEKGEYVHAVVQPEPGVESSETLADELRVIGFRAELARLPTGKLHKKPLRQEYLDVPPR